MKLAQLLTKQKTWCPGTIHGSLDLIGLEWGLGIDSL